MPKRIAIATIGTQGDVQPYVALARALKDRGYSVVVGASQDFREMIESRGLEFCSLGESIQHFLTQARFENAMSQSMLINGPALLAEGQKIVDRAARRAWVMAQGCDAIILNINTSFGIDIAEALDIPAVMVALQPLNTTSEFPLCSYYGPDLGKAFNRISHAATSVQQAYFDLPRNRLRRELMGLEPRKKGGFFKDSDGSNLLTLYAYSALVSPRPRDWPKSAVVTGYWPLNDNSGWEPDADFRAFLEAGDKPVYIGFGSMPFGADRNTQILREAIETWGGRAVVARGWGGINTDELPDTVYAIDHAPHDKLFQYMSGVVHHGGAGTTSAGLHAACPTFIIPQSVDQPYWGRRVHELGCGPEPVRLRKLTPELLAETLSDLSQNKEYKHNVNELAQKLNAEDGTGRAIKHIERAMTNYRPRAERPKKKVKVPSMFVARGRTSIKARASARIKRSSSAAAGE